jgi:hypothetical protein
VSTHWRFELRIRLVRKLTHQQLIGLMVAGANDNWDVARDPIGIALATHGPTDQPALALQRLWADASAWIADQGHPGHVASGRVVSEDLAEREALEPDTPELLAATDVAELLGVSRQRVHQLSGERADFPAPCARLGSGPIWTRPAIEAFDRAWTRKAGRPATANWVRPAAELTAEAARGR